MMSKRITGCELTSLDNAFAFSKGNLCGVFLFLVEIDARGKQRNCEVSLCRMTPLHHPELHLTELVFTI